MQLKSHRFALPKVVQQQFVGAFILSCVRFLFIRCIQKLLKSFDFFGIIQNKWGVFETHYTYTECYNVNNYFVLKNNAQQN